MRLSLPISSAHMATTASVGILLATKGPFIIDVDSSFPNFRELKTHFMDLKSTLIAFFNNPFLAVGSSTIGSLAHLDPRPSGTIEPLHTHCQRVQRSKWAKGSCTWVWPLYSRRRLWMVPWSLLSFSFRVTCNLWTRLALSISATIVLVSFT